MPYCIDLDARKPKILLFDGEELNFDLKYYRVKNALDLTTHDRRVFLSIDKAQKFFDEYNDALKNLHRFFKEKKAPCIKLKRRYMALVTMGLKSFTHRDYDKGWKPGTVFNFDDQTFKITVKLKKITLEGELYRYDFELLK